MLTWASKFVVNGLPNGAPGFATLEAFREQRRLLRVPRIAEGRCTDEAISVQLGVRYSRAPNAILASLNLTRDKNGGTTSVARRQGRA